MTSVICDGIVVARGSFSSKKMSRQVAAARAISVLAPLLETDKKEFDYGVIAEDLGNGVMGVKSARQRALPLGASARWVWRLGEAAL